jgi:hypothetical protein
MRQTNDTCNSELDEILISILTDNKENVVAFFRNKPGSWGYLAGQGVLAYKNHMGRSLTDIERRLVWDRLWWWLNQIKMGLMPQEK